MFGLSLLMILLVIWVVLTVVLLGLVIHRSILSSFRGYNQIFLYRDDVAKEQEQIEVTRRINRLESIIKRLALASGGLLLLIAVIWVYRGLTMTL